MRSPIQPAASRYAEPGLNFENQERLGEALFLELCKELRLSTTAMRQALEQKSFHARVRADFTSGLRSGVNGTPTLFIIGTMAPSILRR